MASQAPTADLADPYFPATPARFADPYPFIERMLEDDPHRSETYGAWLLIRYADIAEALRDPRLGVSSLVPSTLSHLASGDPVLVEGIVAATAPMMGSSDPPEHARVRDVFRVDLSPRALAGLTASIRASAGALLDAAISSGQIDLMRDFAYPLPLGLICDLIGIPAQDRTQVKAWSDDSVILDSSGRPGRESVQRWLRSTEALARYFSALLDERRRSPRDDLISHVAIRAAETGVTAPELVANFAELVVAGHETTTNLIGNGTLALLRHPDQLELLQTDPSMIPGAIEELLRYDPTVQLTERTAIEDVEVARRRLRKGDLVVLMLAAANRDPRMFDEPARLDVRRKGIRHMGFGSGIHFCVGAHLARLEAQIAFEELLDRLPGLRLSGEPIWHERFNFRGLRSLPVAAAPRSRFSGRAG